MTTRRAVLCALVAPLAVAWAGCADDAPAGPNPARLWLALDGSEVQVRLVPVEPPPF